MLEDWGLSRIGLAMVVGLSKGLLLTYPLCIGLAMIVGLSMLLLQRNYCPICMSHVLAMRMYSSACGHRCCAPCWRLFFSTQERSLIQALRRVRASSALCCWGCDAMLDSGVVRKFASRALHTVAAQVAKREEYEQRAQRFNFQCVDCPECSIGVGYNDYSQRTIMCFLCEHQWEVERGWDLGAIIAGWVSAWWPLRPAGLAGSRPCPHCGANIQKDGGCPMMCAMHPASRGAAHAASSLAHLTLTRRRRCGICNKPFRWGFFSNSTEYVIIEHCPPLRRRRGR